MAKTFKFDIEIQDESQYKAAAKKQLDMVPSSLLSFDDRDTVLDIISLRAIRYGDGNDDLYPAFICKDKRRVYTCQLPVFFPRKTFSGKTPANELTAGKCTGTFTEALEEKNFSWEVVSSMKGRKIRVSNAKKIVTEGNKPVTHRIYRLDLVE